MFFGLNLLSNKYKPIQLIYKNLIIEIRQLIHG